MEDTGTSETWSVSANRTTCPEDEFIIYEIVTSNVDDGTFFTGLLVEEILLLKILLVDNYMEVCS